MQQQVMKFMMLFMAVLFFKVASGLCLYFIASSLWSVAERLLLIHSGGLQGRRGFPELFKSLPAADEASDPASQSSAAGLD